MERTFLLLLALELASSARLGERANVDWNPHNNNKAWVQTSFECYLMLCERGRWFLLPSFRPNQKWRRRSEKNRASVYPGKGRFLFIFLWTLSIGYNNFFIILSLTHNFLSLNEKKVFDYLWASWGRKELITIKRWTRRDSVKIHRKLPLFVVILWGVRDAKRVGDRRDETIGVNKTSDCFRDIKTSITQFSISQRALLFRWWT